MNPCLILLFLAIILSWNPESLLAQFEGMAGASQKQKRERRSKRLTEKIQYDYPSALTIPKISKPLPQAEEQVRALSQFSLELYAAMSGDEKTRNKNIICSPWNAAMLLAMLYEGADGKTADEIQKTLHFQGDSKPLEEYLQMVAFNTRARENDWGIQTPILFDSANSFWGVKHYHFHPEYKILLNDRFCAEMYNFDIKSRDKAAQEMNNWIAVKTRQEIPQFLTASEIDPDARFFILGAAYFKGRWSSPFNAGETKPENFYHADGSVSKTAMMNQKEHVSYYEENTFKAIRKNYIGNAHLLILLPNKQEGLFELEKSLTPEKLRQINEQFNIAEVKIKIPRFTFDDQVELIPVLKTLGIQSAFTFNPSTANLSKITSEPVIYINFFRQKAKIKLDEVGTIAAVGSGMGGGMGGRTMVPPEPKTFYAERPFLFMICESTDNSILFMGRVHLPEKLNNNKF